MVNITDVKDIEVKKILDELKKKDIKDKLEQLFHLQTDLMKRYNVPRKNLNTREAQETVRRYVYYMVEELFEMMNCLKLRTWTQTEYQLDEDHLRDELADFIAFLFQVFYLLGMDADKLLDVYIRKYIVNKFRIESKY